MKKAIQIISIAFLLISLSGCVLNTDKPVVVKLGGENIYADEFRFYFLLSQNAYEQTGGGTDIWLPSFNGVKAEEVAKERALESMTTVKITAKQADALGILLTQEDKQKAAEMTDSYSSSLDKKDLEEIGISKDLMQKIMEETVMYRLIFDKVTKNIEVSKNDFDAYLKSYISDPNNNVQQDTDQDIMQAALLAKYTEKIKNDVFQEQYSKWVMNVQIEKNQEIWDSIHILPHASSAK